MTPHIRYHEPHPAHTPRTQTTKSGGGEAFWFGLPGDVPKHRLSHHCSERSPHVLKAESFIMQSHQDPPWTRRTDRQCILRLSSIMTTAIVTKAGSQIYSIAPTLYTHHFAVSGRGLTRSPCQDGLGQSRDEEANGPDPP